MISVSSLLGEEGVEGGVAHVRFKHGSFFHVYGSKGKFYMKGFF